MTFQEAVGRTAPFVKVQPPAIIGQRSPTTTDTNYPKGATWLDESQSPAVLYDYLGGGTWQSNNVTLDTDDTFAAASNSTASSSLAIKTYVDNTAIAGAPVATETVAGIGQLATDAEAIAGTPSTGALALFVTPSNLAAVLAAGGPGSFTTLDASGAVTFSSTGAISMTSDTASLFDVTGAGIDLTLSSDAGRVIVNGEEAAANAITLVSAAGGVDLDAALQVNIASSQSAVDAIRIVASAGGIDVDAVGTAGEDINITNTGASVVISATESIADAIVLNATLGGIDILASGASAGEDIDIVATGSSVNITSTENNAGAILVTANGGASERITLISAQGTGADSINLSSTAGGITLTSNLATADGINLSAVGGGVDIDGDLQVNIASSQNAVDAIRIVASAGGIDIDAVGAATEDINITNTGGSILLVATEAAADAIVLTATTALGGIDINGGTGGITVDSGGVLSLDSAGATNLTATGAFDVSIISTAGSVILNAEEAVADAIQLQTAAGGLDVNTALQINVDSSQAAATAIVLNASNAAGGLDLNAGTGGITVDTTGVLSLDSAGATNLTATGAFDVTVNSTAGSVIIKGEEAVDDAIQLTSVAGGLAASVALSVVIGSTETNADSVQLTSAGGLDITATGAAAKDIDIVCTNGSLNASAGEAIASAIVVNASAGGLQLLAGGGAGLDTIITNTSGSMTLSAGESAADAMNITAGGAAGAINLSAGTGGVTLDSGLVVNITDVATAATPYAVLGSDYVINTDSTGGALEITLPAAPATGRTVVVYDGAGQAAAGGNVTINGNGKNIAAGGSSAATKLLNTAYESYTLYYNGTLWMGQNVA